MTHLKIGSKILGDILAVALRQYHDLLLDVLDLIFGLLEIDDFDGHDLLGSVVHALEHFPERPLADLLLLCEDELGIDLLREKKEQVKHEFFVIHTSRKAIDIII